MRLSLLLIFIVAYVSEVSAQKYLYTIQADLEVLAGHGVSPVPGAQLSTGVKIEKWSVEPGIAVGVDVYRQLVLMPVSAGLKWMPFTNSPLLPYISLNAGYSLDWLNHHTDQKSYGGGGVVSPSIGLRLKTTGKAILNFSAGYKLQGGSIRETISDDLGRPRSITDEKYKFGRICLNFGVGFSEIRFNSKAKLENIP